MIKTVESLKAEAKAILGEQAYEQARQLNIAEINRRFSAAYQNFDDTRAKAYENLQLIRTMGHQL